MTRLLEENDWLTLDSPHKWPEIWKAFPYNDDFMYTHHEIVDPEITEKLEMWDIL